MTKIDLKKLRAAIHEDTKIIRELKKHGDRSGAESMKLRATRHHAMAAHAQNHIHLASKFLCHPYKMNLSERWTPCYLKQGMSRDEQAKFIEKELPTFLIPEAPAESVAKTA